MIKTDIRTEVKADLVDFVTLDRNLQDIIIREYEGVLKEDQHIITKVSGRKAYAFFGLERDKLDDLIRRYRISSGFGVCLN